MRSRRALKRHVLILLIYDNRADEKLIRWVFEAIDPMIEVEWIARGDNAVDTVVVRVIDALALADRADRPDDAGDERSAYSRGVGVEDAARSRYWSCVDQRFAVEAHVRQGQGPTGLPPRRSELP